MRAAIVLAVFVFGTFQVSPSLAAAWKPNCWGDLLVMCEPANPTTPQPKPSKPKPGVTMDNKAIDAGMSEGRDKADID